MALEVDDRVQVNGTFQTGTIVKKQGRKFRVRLDGQQKPTWLDDVKITRVDESVGHTPPATEEATPVVEKVVNEHTPTDFSTPLPYAGKALRAMVNEELTNGTSRPLPKPSVVVSLPKPAADESPTEKDLSTPPESPKDSRPNDTQTEDEAVLTDFWDAINMQSHELRASISHLNFNITDIKDILLAQQDQKPSTHRALLPSKKVILSAVICTLALTVCVYLCAQPYFTPGVWIYNIWLAICDAFLNMWNTMTTPLYTTVQTVSSYLSSVNSLLSTYLSEARLWLANVLRGWADWLAVSKPIDVDVIPEAVTITDTNATATLTNKTANFTLTNKTANFTLSNATFTTLNTWPTSWYIATVGFLVAVPAQVPLIGMGACAIGLIEAVPQVAAMVNTTLF